MALDILFGVILIDRGLVNVNVKVWVYPTWLYIILWGHISSFAEESVL